MAPEPDPQGTEKGKKMSNPDAPDPEEVEEYTPKTPDEIRARAAMVRVANELARREAITLGLPVTAAEMVADIQQNTKKA